MSHFLARHIIPSFQHSSWGEALSSQIRLLSIQNKYLTLRPFKGNTFSQGRNGESTIKRERHVLSGLIASTI